MFSKYAKLKKVLIGMSLFATMACDDTPIYRDSHRRPYANQITNIDRHSENNCALPQCHEDRIRRIYFKEAYGQLINDSTIHVYSGIDGLSVLMICNKEKMTLENTEEVIVTGVARDACPFFTPQFCCDQGFFFELAEIRKY